MKEIERRFPKVEFIVLAGIVSILFAFWRIVSQGIRPIDYIQLPSFLFLVLLFLFRKKISETFMIVSTVVIVALLALGLLFTFGFVGNTLPVFIIFSTMMLVYSNRRIGIISAIVVAVGLFVFGFLVWSNRLELPVSYIAEFVVSLYGWLIVSVVFIVTMIVIFYHFELIRKKYEDSTKQIIASEKRYRELFEDSPVALIEQDFSPVDEVLKQMNLKNPEQVVSMVNSDNNILNELAKKIVTVDLNKEAVRLFEAKSREELIRNMFKTYTDDSISKLKEGLIVLLTQQKEFTCEVDIKTLTGKTKFVILHFSKNDSLSKVRISIEDITQKRQTEKLLRIQHDLSLALRYRVRLNEVLEELLFSALTIESIDSGGIYLVNKETGCLDLACHNGLSDNFVKSVSHYSANSQSAKLIMKGEPLYVNYSELPNAKEDPIRKEEGLKASAVIPIFHNGKIIAVFNFASHSVDNISMEERGLLEAVAGIAGEVISRAQAEDALFLSEEKLRQSEKLRTIGQLAGGIAHDFNNQLMPIMGFADLLKEELKDKPKLVEYLDFIIASSQNASNLTNQLLAFARKGKYLAVPVDLNKLITEVIHLLGRSIDKRIKVVQELSKDFCITFGDPTQLQNAILNIAINSRDAMPDGGELIFSTEVVDVDVNEFNRKRRDLKSGKYVEICVTDSGTGMKKDVEKRIFEPFFTTKERGKGTGMGLAAVYGTLKVHGGTINVYTEYGHGTTMKVYLPLYAEPVKKVLDSIQEENITGRDGNILLIDDEPNVCRTVSAMLEHIGYTVFVAENGQLAKEIYKKNWETIDLVIIDMIMPDMDGRETFLELKRINPSIVALLSSGYSINGQAGAILKEGVKGFLQKPYRQKMLAEKINEMLTQNK